MDFIRYNTTGAQPYNEGGFVKMVANCNGYIVVNTGDDIVRVNDRVLYPGVIGTTNGDSHTVGGNFGEVFLGTIRISFDGTGATPEITVEQKYYILDKKIV